MERATKIKCKIITDIFGVKTAVSIPTYLQRNVIDILSWVLPKDDSKKKKKIKMLIYKNIKLPREHDLKKKKIVK